MSDTEPPSDGDAPVRPLLRVVKGSPSADELAVLAAVVSAVGAGEGGAAGTSTGVRRGGWNDPGFTHRREMVPGPNAWRSALR